MIAVLDTAVVAIALPSMERGLGFTASGIQVEWVLNGYAMALGGLLLLGGRLADVMGPRRVFVAGPAVFGVASVAGGLVAAPWLLVAARIAQGVGAADFEPAALAMVTLLFPEPAARNRALGVFGAMVGLGYLAGMVLGGALTEWLGWQAVLFINVPVALAAVLLALALLPDRRPAGAARTLDLPGAVAITTAVAATLIALAAVPRHGWLAWATLGLAAVGIVLLALFIVIESRSPAPLLPLSVLRLRAVAIADGAALLKSCIGMAQLYVVTLYFQDVLGRSRTFSDVHRFRPGCSLDRWRPSRSWPGRWPGRWPAAWRRVLVFAPRLCSVWYCSGVVCWRWPRPFMAGCFGRSSVWRRSRRWGS